jgi:hypothetical protein
VPVEQFAFEGGEEALAEGIVVAVADRSHARLGQCNWDPACLVIGNPWHRARFSLIVN